MVNTEYSIPTNYRTLFEKFIRFPQALKFIGEYRYCL